VTVWSAPAFAENAAPNYFIANCFNCHGTDGKATGAIPPLAGLDKAYFIQQIAAFKSGTRPATAMHQLAKGYTDEEIARAADYFAKQKK
jgi:cytochrome c553